MCLKLAQIMKYYYWNVYLFVCCVFVIGNKKISHRFNIKAHLQFLIALVAKQLHPDERLRAIM